MEDRKNHLLKVPALVALKSIGSANPPGTVPEAANDEREAQNLKNCRDCEIGGFGATYGYSPR